MHSVSILPTVAILSITLAGCSESALDPSAVTGEPVEATAQLALASEELADLLGALDDLLLRELPALEHKAEARHLVLPLEELVVALLTNERSRVVEALRLSRGALDLYRTDSSVVTADLPTLGAIELVHERLESAAARGAS